MECKCILKSKFTVCSCLFSGVEEITLTKFMIGIQHIQADDVLGCDSHTLTFFMVTLRSSPIVSMNASFGSEQSVISGNTPVNP